MLDHEPVLDDLLEEDSETEQPPADPTTSEQQPDLFTATEAELPPDSGWLTATPDSASVEPAVPAEPPSQVSTSPALDAGAAQPTPKAAAPLAASDELEELVL